MNSVILQHPAFTLRPLSTALGAEVIGIDLTFPLDDELFKSIYSAFLDHQVLLFRGRQVSPRQQVELARRFGEVQVHVMNQYHSCEHPEIYFLSNLDENGRPNGRHPDRGTLSWHTDGSWRRVTGQATLMYGEQIPARGGETHFCDMYGAYAGLSDEWRNRIKRLRAVHSLEFSRNRRHGEKPMTAEQLAQVPPVDHPVVRTHPDTGRRAAFLGDHAETIADLEYNEGRALVDRINQLIVRPELIYEHRWQHHDLVLWDNRCLLHRATEYDTATEARVVRRCTVLGEVPS